MHEADLVDKVGNVVDHVEGGLVGNAGKEAKEVAQRVDAPAKANDKAHVAEGLLDSLRAVAAGLGGLTGKDLKEDEAPSAQAKDESRPAESWGGLANVAEDQHEDGADEEPPESTGGDWGLGSLQDEVELDHLQRQGDAPVNVTVHNWGLVQLHPVLAHVHVVHAGNEGDQATNVQGCPPVVLDSGGLGEEEHCGGNHRNGDDPEGHCNSIGLSQEGLPWLIHLER